MLPHTLPAIPVEIFVSAIKYKNELRKTKNCVSVTQQFELVSSQHFFAHMGPNGVIPTFSIPDCLVHVIKQPYVLSLGVRTFGGFLECPKEQAKVISSFL